MFKYGFFIIIIIQIYNIELDLIKIETNNSKKDKRNLIKKQGYENILSKLSTGLYHINITVGSNNQKLNLIFDTGSSLIWFYDKECLNCHYNNSFNTKESNTYKNSSIEKEIKYLSGKIKGNISVDNIQFSNIKIQNFKFILINNSTLNIKIDGIIGFNKYKENNIGTSISFIDQLYDKRKIEKKKFLCDIINTGKIYIGEIPNHLSKNEGIVFVSKYSYNDWWINFEKIIIKNNSYLINKTEQDIVIDSGTNGIIFPLKLLDFFKNNLFNDLIKENICKIKNDDKINISHFECIDDIRKNKTFLSNNISFSIENNSIDIPMNYLLNKNDYSFSLYFTDYIDKWIFGIPFFESHSILFDKETESITIYKTKFVQKKKKVNNQKLNETIAVGITMFIFICLICGSFWYLNKQRAAKRITKDMIESNIKYRPIV